MNCRALGAVVALGTLQACATPPQITPVGFGEPLAIVVIQSPPADHPVRIRNQALGEGVTAGVGSGLIAGGLWGFTCGPLAVLCVPLGAAAGAITGTVAGAAVGVTGALSDKKAVQLRERLSHLRESRNLLDELHTHITDRARRHWSLTADPSRAVVTVELQDLQLSSTRDERIGFVMQVRVSVRPGGAAQTSAPSQKLYEYAGPLNSLTLWLDEGSDFLDVSLSSAIQQIAAQIVSELAMR